MKVALVLCNDMHMDINNANILLDKLLKNGYEVTSDYTIADTVIVYTCAFGPSKMYSMRVLADVMLNCKRNAKVIVTGCLLKLNMDELTAIPGVWVQNFDGLLKQLDNNECAKDYSLFPKNISKYIPMIPQNKVIISEGCLHRCSYCVYPQVAPKYKSKPMEEIFDEVKKLYETESVIYITGAQETSDYGIDLYGERSFAKLIEKIATDFPDSNFVIGWFHPAGLTDEVISAISKHTNIVEIMLHIQHVSPGILKAMGRPQIIDVDAKVKKLRAANSNIRISTEVIVGFPGESATDFENLVSYLEHADFCDIGVASFEAVLGTKAYDMPYQIDRNTKRERMEYIKNRFGATVYPADEGSAGSILEEYINATEVLRRMPKTLLNGRQVYNGVAGIDTTDKMEGFKDHVISVCDLITNARSEFDLKKTRKLLVEKYTPSARKLFYDILANGNFKAAIKERAIKLLL